MTTPSVEAIDASERAARAFALGIFSLLAFGLFAPYALVVARRARQQVRDTPDATNVGLARAGVVLATIGCAWLAFWVVVVLVLIATG